MKKGVAIILILAVLSGLAMPSFAAQKNAKQDNSLKALNQRIEAHAYILASLNEGTVSIAAQRNADEVLYPASLTKIVTAIVTINQVKDLSRNVTVSKAAVESQINTGSQIAYLREGETISYEELLYLSMLFSACDACQVLAEAVGGSVKGFSKMMNDWAKSVGCKNTHFVNPDGLHDDNHYTTATDLLKITSAALKNSTFKRIATATSFDYNGSTFYHTNRMLHPLLDDYYYPYAKGIKTGYTKEAGNCLITMAENKHITFLAIVLKSVAKKIDDKWIAMSYIDAKNLFEWGFKSFEKRAICGAEDVLGYAAVSGGATIDIPVTAKSTASAIVPKGAKANAFRISFKMDANALPAPIRKGETLGKAVFTYNERIVGSVPVIAGKDVKAAPLRMVFPQFDSYIADKPVFGYLAILLRLFI
ncbi:MAG: D-alanyl-D-alanine carboxypeptidase [Ruminococcaceae bacterium]|nr:D-alanyl-D-alanine carboxypeptidase [Oscillospiraceae bacterium]